MSHWKKFESAVLKSVKRDMLSRAVTEMGKEIRKELGLDFGITSIRNSWGNETVTAGFVVDGRPIALGVNLKDNKNGTESLEVSGDFYGTGLREDTFVDKLAQTYKKVDVTEQLEEQGWTIDEINFDEQGQIVMEAYRTA